MGEKMTIMHVGSGDEFSLLRQCAQRCVDNGGEWYSPVQAAAILGEHVGEPALLADAAFMGMATPECILRLLDRAEDHLTQPAQAVDVGAINSVIVDLEERARNGGDAYPDEFESWASALTRAIGNAQAVDAWRIDFADGSRMAVFEEPPPAMYESVGAKITPLITAALPNANGKEG